jgi:class 3 adenylate cyclase
MPDLPQGTVTFLFTDIEESTRLLKELRQRYGEVLADQRRLLRTAFAENHGREVDMQGDAFFAVFGTAKHAVAAAVAAQRAIAAHSWPEGIPLRVRMGLHTGEPALGGEGYLGLAVHRAARICSAAHGSQVLLSRSTSAVLEDDVPDGTSLRDLGDHQLKDIDRPERIHQVLIDGLLNDLRAPKTYDAQPVKATPFAGQENELARAAQAALATRRARLLEWIRRPASTPLLRARQLLRLMVEAAWSERIARLQLLGFVVAVALGIAFQPWIAVAALLAYAVVFATNLRGLARVHAIGRTGFRLYSIAAIAPERQLREAMRDLGGTLVKADRLSAQVDRSLAGVSQRFLARRLEELRRRAAGFPAAAQNADMLARQMAALDRMIAHRRALDEEFRQLEPRLDTVGDRIFDVRLGRTPAADLGADINASREVLGAIVGKLADSLREVNSYGRVPSQHSHRFARIGR